MSRQLLGVKQPPLWLDPTAAIDPKRHFANADCRIAKGSLDYLAGAGEYIYCNGSAMVENG